MSKKATKKEIEVTNKTPAVRMDQLGLKSLEENQNKILELWQEQVDAFSSEQFDSLETAIKLIISAVTQKLNLQGEQAESTANFLQMMFNTDPALCDELRSLLNIRE